MSTQNKGMVVSLSVVALAALIGYAAVYTPLVNQRISLEKKITETKQKSDILVNIKQLTTRLENYEKLLTDKKNESWLINKVSAIANDAKIKLLSVEPQKKQAIGDFEKISVKVDAECSYHKLGKFVALLVNSKELLKIDKLEIKTESDKTRFGEQGSYSSGKGSGEQVPSVSLIVSTYNVK